MHKNSVRKVVDQSTRQIKLEMLRCVQSAGTKLKRQGSEMQGQMELRGDGYIHLILGGNRGTTLAPSVNLTSASFFRAKAKSQ